MFSRTTIRKGRRKSELSEGKHIEVGARAPRGFACPSVLYDVSWKGFFFGGYGHTISEKGRWKGIE